jgi:hypothetical protein
MPEGLGMAESGSQAVTEEAVRWAFRLLVGRDVQDSAELRVHLQHRSLDGLRAAFLATPEFEALRSAGLAGQDYRVPLFLLRPPTDPAIPWRFSPPSLMEPVSQLCTVAQLREPAFASLCAELDLVPAEHRKLWEFCFVLAAMKAAWVMRPGARALGFGVGTEPLPALLARYGAMVTATDAPMDIIANQGWDTTGQHAAGLSALDRPNIIGADRLAELVEFRPVDMNAIPADLRGYDVCWSSCALEHLGSIRHGLDFIEASLETLKPGGYAIHTTELNLSSEEETVDVPGLCLFRKQDIEALAGRLVAAGHRLLPLNFHPGDGLTDAHIDLPPYAMPHLKLQVGRFVTTSIGLIVQKAG